MTAKRFTHKKNQLGMQFICYDDKAELLGTFADEKGVTNIVELLNRLHDKIDRFEFILQEAIRTERTDIGKNVLKQLADNLGVKYE